MSHVLERFNKKRGRGLKRLSMIPRGFGLRQPSAALRSPGLWWESGRGLPQSKTLTRGSFIPTISVATVFLKPLQLS
jgi:hypothetical protein